MTEKERLEKVAEMLVEKQLKRIRPILVEVALSMLKAGQQQAVEQIQRKMREKGML
jgi:geranylgeranyl pyrophosphate synthase